MTRGMFHMANLLILHTHASTYIFYNEIQTYSLWGTYCICTHHAQVYGCATALRWLLRGLSEGGSCDTPENVGD